MAKTKSKSQLSAFPPYFEWRSGRPRWNPSPKLKRHGWRSKVLVDAQGQLLGFEAATKLGREINEAVTGSLNGVPVPVAFIEFYPAAAAPTASGKIALPTPASEKSIGYLLDKYLEHGENTGTLSPKTIKDYRLKITATLTAIGELRGKSLTAIRACEIDLLKRPGEGSGLPFHLLDAYDHLLANKGANWSRSCLTATSAWISWVQFNKSLMAGLNPCLSIKRRTVEGRTVTFEDHEIPFLLDAADWIGMPSIGDAIVLALDLTWAQQDLLALQWNKIDAEANASGRRIKTNVTMFPRANKAGRIRLAQIRQRQAQWPEAVRPTAENGGHVICSELNYQPWKADYFRHAFALVRDIASADAPYGLGNNGLREKQFRDLRDTAVTMLDELGISDKMIATRSGHQFGSVQRTLGKHYSERRRIALAANQFIADRMGDEG